jgi:hypothetical protein
MPIATMLGITRNIGDGLKRRWIRAKASDSRNWCYPRSSGLLHTRESIPTRRLSNARSTMQVNCGSTIPASLFLRASGIGRFLIACAGRQAQKVLSRLTPILPHWRSNPARSGLQRTVIFQGFLDCVGGILLLNFLSRLRFSLQRTTG